MVAYHAVVRAEMLALDGTRAFSGGFGLFDQTRKAFRHRLLQCKLAHIVQQSGVVGQLRVYVGQRQLGELFGTAGNRKAMEHEPLSQRDAASVTAAVRIERPHDLDGQKCITNLPGRQFVQAPAK